jgi:hypothetical protein
VYNEISLQLDRWENEALPKIELSTQAIAFKSLAFRMPSNMNVTLKNVGEVCLFVCLFAVL